MMYTTPRLVGYAAIAVIQALEKNNSHFDLGNTGPRTVPAYEADE